jgi:hypothetical protein
MGEHVWDRGEVYARFWWENLKDDPGVNGRITVKWIFKKWDVEYGLD